MDSLFTIDSLDDFKTASQQVLDHLCENTSNSSTIVTETAQEVRQLIIDCNFDLDEVAAVIKSKSWDQDKIKHFVTILQGRRIDLLYALLTHSNVSHGESLTNFNWVLKLVLGSSELKSLKYPLLQLTLHTETSDGIKKQKMFELNKEAVHKLMQVLENVE